MTHLYQRIINLPCKAKADDYKESRDATACLYAERYGHNKALKAAAELAQQTEAELRRELELVKAEAKRYFDDWVKYENRCVEDLQPQISEQARRIAELEALVEALKSQ